MVMRLTSPVLTSLFAFHRCYRRPSHPQDVNGKSVPLNLELPAYLLQAEDPLKSDFIDHILSSVNCASAPIV